MKFIRVQGHYTEDEEIVGIGIIRLNLDHIVAYWKLEDGITRILLYSGEEKDISIDPIEIDKHLE